MTGNRRRSQHSPLLGQHLETLESGAGNGPIIDLACGEGRNGLFLARRGLPVVFADRSASRLRAIADALGANPNQCETWQIDLEQQNINPFGDRRFSAVIVFRYLHRPLFPFLREVVTPGGIVIYETFTVDNIQFGRPDNPDFLLAPGELKSRFRGWKLLHYFEGIVTDPDRAVARIVCQKPVVSE